MSGINQMFLLIVFQGFYLGSEGQRWTFPDEVTALIGSCVEIPCTYDPGTSGPSSTVWYLFNAIRYPEILNTKYPSLVLEEYSGRTSLVPGQDCTLRIDPVRREDGNRHYYPGIAEDKNTNAYEKDGGIVYLSVKGSPGNIDISGKESGEGIIVECSVHHTCGSRPPTIQWNKPGEVTNRSKEIYRGQWREESSLTFIPSDVDDGSDVRCTLTYPGGIRTKSRKLSISYSPKTVTVTVIGRDGVMEGSDVTLQCKSVSNPDVSEYEWYKGKKKTRLEYTGREIIVGKVTGNMEPYSCAAINTVGRGESALMEIPVLYAAAGVHITVKDESKFTELTCDFLSSRPDVSHYTWMKDGSILHNETGKTMTLHSNDTYGRYSCIAHNRAGDSSSEEICIKCHKVNLPLILRTVAGILFLVINLTIYILCLRQTCNSRCLGSPKQRTAAGNLSSNTMEKDKTLIEQKQYENIQSGRKTQPDSMGSMSSVKVHVKENCAIYSNS
ncbi:B-cell receptor CD22-like [Hyla sarda]|uniref:B-cell receptor CD22-like n=1 Tax=Hyla sarda TaxID=327740 RepID=UPI0024C32EE3|nr:B-cell receptor CD22-like [Hyla sarda]